MHFLLDVFKNVVLDFSIVLPSLGLGNWGDGPACSREARKILLQYSCLSDIPETQPLDSLQFLCGSANQHDWTPHLDLFRLDQANRVKGNGYSSSISLVHHG